MLLHEQISKLPVSRIPLNLLQPTLQAIGERGVKVKHFDKLRDASGRIERVSRAIIVGGWNMTDSEVNAFDTLGEENFTIGEESSRMLALPLPKWEDKQVPYKPETLQHHSQVNIKNGEDWRLVFVNDLSPLKILEQTDHVAGIDFYGDPFGEKYQQTFQRWEDEHQGQGIRGYRLINFNPFPPTLWETWLNDRVKKIREMREYEITPPNWVLEAWLAHHFLTGKTIIRETERVTVLGHHLATIGGTTELPNSFVSIAGFVHRSQGTGGRSKFLVHHAPFNNLIVAGIMIMRKPDLIL